MNNIGESFPTVEPQMPSMDITDFGSDNRSFEQIAVDIEALVDNQVVKELLAGDLKENLVNFIDAYRKLGDPDTGVSQWEMAKLLLDALSEKVAKTLGGEVSAAASLSELYIDLEAKNPNRVEH